MKYLPVRCDLHGWLLLDGKTATRRENHVIECVGHRLERDTRDFGFFEASEHVSKTRGLTDEEFEKLTRKKQP
jgi:hypothetical protein